MYTMKVMYIYRQVEKTEGDNTLNAITALREAYKMRKNTERVDMIFRHLQSKNMEHLFAPRSAAPPQAQSKYSSGWKIA